MKNKLKKLAQTLHPAKLTSLAAYLLKDEAISGKLIIGAAVLALLAANSPLSSMYESFWSTTLSVGFGNWLLSLDLRHWVSDGLMVFFFLVVGLELRRELEHGELKNKRTALLPFAAAIGGILVPATIYLVINSTSGAASGWAIPTATDIALAIGVLALLGKRIPSSVRLFLLTLAIVDDVVAVVIIAAFYNAGLNVWMLLLGLTIVAALYAFRNARFMTLPLFSIIGIILWLVIYNSGIHSSITGAVLGLLAPLILKEGASVSVAERLEKLIIPFSTLLVVPIFAFANVGIPFTGVQLSDGPALQVASGVILGLVVGKVVGIFGASWIMIKSGISSLPTGANWNHIIGAGMLAGIGFTVSIFVTELAFDDTQLINITKISIVFASIVSGTLGYVALRFLYTKPKHPEQLL